MKKYNIDPFMEKALSDEYYKLRSSRDFVSYEGCLLYS